MMNLIKHIIFEWKYMWRDEKHISNSNRIVNYIAACCITEQLYSLAVHVQTAWFSSK